MHIITKLDNNVLKLFMYHNLIITIMKKKSFWSLLSMFMVVSLCVSFVSCGSDDEEDKVVVNMPSVSFGESGGSQTIQVTSNTGWTVTGAPNWLSVSPSQSSGNGTISITANANTGKDSRSCTLYISAGSASTQVSVYQSAKNQSLADRVEGVYSGRLMLGETVMEDAYIIKIIKQTDTTVTVDAPFFGGDTYNFNLSENGSQIMFSNSTIQNFSMSVMGNQVSISYLSSGGNMLTYSGIK